jgi:hypothetical protein
MRTATVLLTLLLASCSTSGEVFDRADADDGPDGDGDGDADVDGDADADVDTDGDGDVADCFSEPQAVTELHSVSYHPDISADGLTIYLVALVPPTLGLTDLWYATRPDLASPFDPPVHLAEISSEAEDRGPNISTDGLTIYFNSDREGGQGSYDIWRATRPDLGSPFGEPENVEELNLDAWDGVPHLTADGLTIYFASNRIWIGSMGALDIWVATRPDLDSPFGSPRNVVELNSTGTDASPSLTADGLTIYFHSDRPGGAGDMDLWVATRPDTSSPFGTPENLAELNTSSRDWDADIAADGSTLYFTSSDRLWVTHRTCP